MYTKADFQKAIENNLAAYPTIAALYQAGDPRVRQHLDAMATMLAMVSSQIETAQNEMFEKTRESTILSDAAMRGIIRRGRAARVRLIVKNDNDAPFQVDAGRVLLDANGLFWKVQTGATIPASGTGTIEAVQKYRTTLTHTVAGSEPFYAIEIPAADDGGYLCAISVQDADGDFTYRDRYINTDVGERVYHVEADDQQRIYVRFGFQDVVGYQPEDGHQFTLHIDYTNGKVTPEVGSPFSFETLQAPAESLISMSMDVLLEAGSDPVAMGVLRDMAKYPSIYRKDAVFLGEFGFLVREHFPDAQFISVWNEVMEEQARGPDIKNINCLFVAFFSATGDEKTKTATEEDAIPVELTEDELTETQKSVRQLIQEADNSYRVRFFTPVISKIPMTIKARVATAYISKDVQAQIVAAILNRYGKDSEAARHGQQRPLYREVYALLKEQVPALSDGNADLTVVIGGSEDYSVRPELWRFVAEDSLQVTVDTTNIVQHTWGG